MNDDSYRNKQWLPSEKVNFNLNRLLFSFFKNDSIVSKQDKRIIQPNKNRGNNSPPAGKLRLSKPKNIDRQTNDNDVKYVAIFNGRTICIIIYPFLKKRRPDKAAFLKYLKIILPFPRI